MPVSADRGSLPVRPRGRFLVLEGLDGCGKTTQLEALAEWLPGSGLLPAGARLLTTREPGGPALGLALRQLLLHAPAGLAPCPGRAVALCGRSGPARAAADRAGAARR